MAFSENVEVISPQFGGDNSNQQQAEEAKKLQKHKWLVLTITFVVVLGAALTWVWSRPPIYQSQAILHFSYASQLTDEQSSVSEEQITLNSKRLTSYRILEELSLLLAQEYTLELSPETLSTMLSTEPQLSSRIINLYAIDGNANLLQPVVEQWLALYLAKLAEETIDNTAEDIMLGQQKLVALEEKILEQRAFVEQYSEDNNIISMERDENRTLAKIKSLGSALDEAENSQAEATATLASVRESIANGEQITHPQDKARLDELRSGILDSEGILKQLAQRYTEEYMRLDPDVVNRKRNLETAKERLVSVSAESQQNFLEDLQRTVAASKGKQVQLEQELDQLGREAQEFDQKLQEFGRQTRSLRQLEEQAQALKDQLVEMEVQKPFEAKISVLEEPFAPTFPISPHYWRDTGIAAGVATLASLFALILFSFINRQKQPAATMTSYTVVPPSGLTLGQQAEHQALEQQRMAMLGQQQTPLQLGQSENEGSAATSSSPQRLLNENECQSLYKVANREGKVAMALILSGVSPEELLSIQCQNIAQNTLTIDGDYPRQVVLSDECADILTALTMNKAAEDPLWAARLDAAQFDQMMINIAHDAGLAYPEQFSLAALRHTYLTYLVSQGARLNDLEQVAGYVSPGELSLYRQVNRRGDPVDLEHLVLQYPLSAKVS